MEPELKLTLKPAVEEHLGASYLALHVLYFLGFSCLSCSVSLAKGSVQLLMLCSSAVWVLA